MNIGVFGGAFDPPHLGHIHAARQATEHLSLDKLLIVPTGRMHYKQPSADAPTPEQRLEMATLAFSELPNAQVLDLETSRKEPSYTCDTLQAIRQSYPDARLFLILGEDAFATLPDWYQANRVLAAATPAVIARTPEGGERIAKTAEGIFHRFGVGSEIIGCEACPVSSSEIRALLPQRQGTVFLQRQVYDYILFHRLYSVRANFDHLRFAAYQLLDPKRTRHVAGCEQEAVRLALRWGADPDLAREAAILHDITKRCDSAEQLNLCRKYDIITDEIEKTEYKLLHSKTGAALAKDLFAVSDAVYDAIYCHTTGKENMTLLDKIIYIADYIEPNRDFDGLARLRALAYADLDRAVMLGITMSIEDMNRRGIVPHPNSLGAMAYLKKQKDD